MAIRSKYVEIFYTLFFDDSKMDIRPTDGFSRSSAAMACLVGRGSIDSCKNARWTCFLLPEESGEGRQVVYLP